MLLLLQVFRLVASILKLGNLTFIPTTNLDGTEGATVGNEYGKPGFQLGLKFSLLPKKEVFLFRGVRNVTPRTLPPISASCI